ncbi:MAG: hypothetical protein ABI680_05740 [Chthoniobacteraceae bacterium]
MTDPDTLKTVLRIGVAPALLAAVFLYLVTSRGERSGFHLFPSTPLEWAHYWFRSLCFLLVCGFCADGPRSGNVGYIFIVGTLVLFTFSITSANLTRGFRIAGITLSVLFILLVVPRVNR